MLISDKIRRKLNSPLRPILGMVPAAISRIGIPEDRPQRPVLSWRWVAGGLLHFAVVAYVVGVSPRCLLAPLHASTETVARLALRLRLWFLIDLAVVPLTALPAAALLDRGLRRRRARRPACPLSPAAEQSRRVAEAVHAPLDDAPACLLTRMAGA